eukprot:316738-Prymnesium_polylepis.2
MARPAAGLAAGAPFHHLLDVRRRVVPRAGRRPLPPDVLRADPGAHPGGDLRPGEGGATREEVARGELAGLSA